MILDTSISKSTINFKNINPLYINDLNLIQVGKWSTLNINFDATIYTSKQYYLMGVMATFLASEAIFGDDLTILIDAKILGRNNPFPLMLERQNQQDVAMIQKKLLKKFQEGLEQEDIDFSAAKGFNNVKIQYTTLAKNKSHKALNVLYSFDQKTFQIVYDLGYFSKETILKLSQLFSKVFLLVTEKGDWLESFNLEKKETLKLSGWLINEEKLKETLNKILYGEIVALNKHLVTSKEQSIEIKNKLLNLGFETVTTPYVSIDRTDQKLFECWSKILKTPQINFKTNFFENGGNSLRFIKLVNNINKKFDKKWMIMDLIKYPKYEQQYKLLTSQLIHVKKLSGVQSLKPFDQNKKNIVLLHDVTGDCNGYLPLIQKTQNLFNIWTVTARLKNSFGPYDCSINQIAQDYINQLPKKLENIVLLGWSLGGRIAFEMANLLNKRVSKLLLFDSMDFGLLQSKVFTLEGEKQILNSIGVNFSNENSIEELWAKEFNINKDDLLIPEWFENLFPYWKFMELDEIIKRFNNYRSLSKAGLDYYTNAKLKIPIIYYLPESSNNTGQTWMDKSYNFNVSKISGDHFTVFKEDNLNSILKDLL